MTEEEREARYALRLPAHLMEEMRQMARQHDRSLNKEFKRAVEHYLRHMSQGGGDEER